MIPYPFSKGVYLWGEPIFVPSDADASRFEMCRVALERSLNALAERADRYWDRS